MCSQDFLSSTISDWRYACYYYDDDDFVCFSKQCLHLLSLLSLHPKFEALGLNCSPQKSNRGIECLNEFLISELSGWVRVGADCWHMTSDSRKFIGVL